MKKSKMFRIIALVIVSMFLAINIQINLDSSIAFWDSFAMDEIFVLILWGLYYILMREIIIIKDKRAKVISFILATIFAAIEIIGFSIHNYNSLDGIIGSKGMLLKSALKFVAYICTFYCLILLGIKKILPRIKLKEEEKVNQFFTNNKKSFWICFAIIFVAYIPYFLHNYPGIFTTDSIAEMHSAIESMGELLNHHPVFHILIVSICLRIGNLFGSYNIGIAIYSLLQMIFTSMIFAYLIKYMAKKNVNIYIRAFTLAFCALYPPFATYSVTMWKDIPFALMMILFVIQIIEIVTNNDYFKGKMNLVCFFLISILVILYRNNGIYVVVLSMLALLIVLKKSRKKLGILTVAIIAFYIIFKGPIFSLFNITDGPVREALSVPLQQIARTMKYKEDKLTNEEKKEIYRFLPVENLGEKYYPLISDNVKDNFNNEEFSENKMDFILLWMKLFFKAPKEYVEAFLDNSYGYWYPQAINWIVPDWYDYKEDNLIQFKKEPIVNITLMNEINNVINQRKMPVISMLFSIGFMFWIVLFCISYIIYKKKYKMVLIYIPILSLWLTTIASPVWCEYRYIYSMFTCIPLLTVLSISLVNSGEKTICQK